VQVGKAQMLSKY